jgi:cytidyltransferase-like protein
MVSEVGGAGSQRCRVLCCGTFDHLHPGHESFLRQAAALGDELHVVVARDRNVQRIKGRLPDRKEAERLRQVQALGLVAVVRLGCPGADFLQVIRDIQPDVIALGYDQSPPPGLAKAFPHCRIETLQAHHPERYKSSLLRRQRNRQR